MNCGTILYVEDEENDVMFMRHAWKKAGLLNPLQVVTDGEQAMHYLASEGKYANRGEYPMPFLVLLDLKLPKVSGLELIKWIREQPAIHTLQVVVLTSSNQPMDIHAAHALRANAYLVKPPDAEGLTQMVASLQAFWMSQAQTPPECLQFKK
jgi:CheY-like chemotaxis protein